MQWKFKVVFYKKNTSLAFKKPIPKYFITKDSNENVVLIFLASSMLILSALNEYFVDSKT